MDKPKTWSKAELAEWKKFWESEMGQAAIARMEQLQNQCLLQSMQVAPADQIQFFVGRAAGIGIILDDIQQGVLAATKEEKGGKAQA